MATPRRLYPRDNEDCDGPLPQYGVPVNNYELFEPAMRPAVAVPLLFNYPSYSYERPTRLLLELRELGIPFDSQHETEPCAWPADCPAYSPFGPSYPPYRTANPSPPTTSVPDSIVETCNTSQIPPSASAPPLAPIAVPQPITVPKREEIPPLQDAPVKKRIVAEVKPMRPTYSDILSKTPKNGNTPEGPIKKPFVSKDAKFNSVKQNNYKFDKIRNFNPDKSAVDDKLKKLDSDKKKMFNSQSSGSESGENAQDFNKSKFNKKPTLENKERPYENANLTPDATDKLDEPSFVFIEPPDEEKPKKRNPKKNTTKTTEKNEPKIEEIIEPTEEYDDIVFQESNADIEKTKRKIKDRSGVKSKNSERNKKANQYKVKKPKNNEYINLVQACVNNWIAFMLSCLFWLFHLVSDICQMSAQLSADLFSSMCVEVYSRTRSVFALIKERILSMQWIYDFGYYIDNKYGHTRMGIWRKFKWFKSDAKKEYESEYTKKNHTNIPLPSTGEEAMKRLLACKGKDPYSILGVGVQCSDDDIKRYYRRQAFLVHPDKNQQPGAEEAFKILQHAFDLIGEPERREAYEQSVLETRHAEAARNELADLVARLQEKVRRAASTIRCSGCSNRHPRTITNRACYAARYCSQCHIHHSAKEGDIWAESSCWGLIWMYYACMDGAVYQITQWASCQKKNLKHLKANTHHVQYRIVLGNKPQHGNPGKAQNNNINDADLEDFLNNLYAKTNQPTAGQTPGKTMPNTNMPSNDTMRNKRKGKKTK